jgi:hypothetical protein
VSEQKWLKIFGSLGDTASLVSVPRKTSTPDGANQQLQQQQQQTSPSAGSDSTSDLVNTDNAAAAAAANEEGPSGSSSSSMVGPGSFQVTGRLNITTPVMLPQAALLTAAAAAAAAGPPSSMNVSGVVNTSNVQCSNSSCHLNMAAPVTGSSSSSNNSNGSSSSSGKNRDSSPANAGAASFSAFTVFLMGASPTALASVKDVIQNALTSHFQKQQQQQPPQSPFGSSTGSHANVSSMGFQAFSFQQPFINVVPISSPDFTAGIGLDPSGEGWSHSS